MDWKLVIAIVWIVIIGGFIYYMKRKKPSDSSSSSSMTPIKNLVFKSNAERDNYLLQTSKINELVIVVWFESDKLKLENWLQSEFLFQKVVLFSDFTPNNLHHTYVLWGHHPLWSVEYNFIVQLNDSISVFLVSLDDELMQYFGSAKIKRLMESLGHQEGETIENKMIDMSIRKAQEDIEKQVLNPKSAPSAKEWFRLNVLDYNQKIQY